MTEPTTESGKAQVALVSAIWHCIVDASSMNVVMSGGEVNAAIRGFRAAIEAEAVAAERAWSLDVDRLARAICRGDRFDSCGDNLEYHRKEASRIAANYAVLAAVIPEVPR